MPTIGPGAGMTIACQLALPFRTTEALDQGALLYMCLLCFCEYCFCSVLCICLWVLLLLCFMYMLVCKFVCIASALICMYACMLGVYAGVGRGVFCWGAFFSSYSIFIYAYILLMFIWFLYMNLPYGFSVARQNYASPTWILVGSHGCSLLLGWQN